MTTITRNSKSTPNTGSGIELEKDRREMAQATEKLRVEVGGAPDPQAARQSDGLDRNKRPLLNLWADKSASGSEFVLLGSAGAPGTDEPAKTDAKTTKTKGTSKHKGSSSSASKQGARAESQVTANALKVPAVRAGKKDAAAKPEHHRMRKAVLVTGGLAATAASIGGAVAAITNNGPSQPTDPSITQNTNQTSNDDVKNAVDDYANGGQCTVDSSGVRISYDAFQKMVENASTGLVFSGDEEAQITGAFGRLSTEDQSRALEYLLSQGHEEIVNRVSQTCTAASLDLDGFKKGADMALNDGMGLNDDEEKSIELSFMRLSKTDQPQALDYLLEVGSEDLFLRCAKRSDAPLTAQTFKKALDTALNDGQGLNDDEEDSIQIVFERLSQEGQTEALDYLLELGREDLYNRCAALTKAPLDFEAFKQGLDMVIDDGMGVNDDEDESIVNAFTRLDDAGQRQALDYLLQLGREDLFNRCNQKTNVSLDFAAFKHAIDTVIEDGMGVNDDEEDSVVSTFKRLNDSDQSKALDYLLELGREDLYKRCSGESIAGLDFASFKQAMDVAATDGAGLNDDEEDSIFNAFVRLSPEDQGSALDYLLEIGNEDLFNRCAAISPGSISLQGFNTGADAAQTDGACLNDDEEASIKSAFTKLSETDRESALNYLLNQGYDDLFNVCMEV